MRIARAVVLLALSLVLTLDAAPASAQQQQQQGTATSEEGRYRLVGNDGAVVDEGKYLSLWKRVSGEWMLHRQMWSSNLPPR